MTTSNTAFGTSANIESKARDKPVSMPHDPTAEAVLRRLERCCTCAKVDYTSGVRACAVLYDMIGETRDCWAWSDDQGWEMQVRRYVKAYSQGWRGGVTRTLSLEQWEERHDR